MVKTLYKAIIWGPHQMAMMLAASPWAVSSLKTPRLRVEGIDVLGAHSGPDSASRSADTVYHVLYTLQSSEGFFVVIVVEP